MKKQKKGQIKIQQMAFMLIAVTLFFIVAGLFILTINFANLKDTSKILNENNALLLVSKIADSPELSCGNSFGHAMSDCIDTDKVMALENRSKDYSGFWGVSGIEIVEIYPNETGIECSSGNYPDCSKITLIAPSNGTGVSNFVSLCRKEQGGSITQCNLGEIIVTYNA